MMIRLLRTYRCESATQDYGEKRTSLLCSRGVSEPCARQEDGPLGGLVQYSSGPSRLGGGQSYGRLSWSATKAPAAATGQPG